MTGTLRRKGDTYEIAWDAPAEVATAHNEAGRGAELAELVKFGDALYTFDDRTGIMFQVMNAARSDAADAPFLVPRHIFSEGPGNVGDKGLKIEWATVKDGAVVLGSFGKEFTNAKGEVVHANNLWAVHYDRAGVAAHVNWKPYYDAMRATLGYTHPGYLLHEAVLWSPHHRKWFVFPRRVSKEKYDDVSDERRGSNMIIMASHDFKEVTSTTVGVSGGGGEARARRARALRTAHARPHSPRPHPPPLRARPLARHPGRK
jgi:soluble calcium-activated nucleotidase 1